MAMNDRLRFQSLCERILCEQKTTRTTRKRKSRVGAGRSSLLHTRTATGCHRYFGRRLCWQVLYGSLFVFSLFLRPYLFRAGVHSVTCFEPVRIKLLTLRMFPLPTGDELANALVVPVGGSSTRSTQRRCRRKMQTVRFLGR